MIRRSFTSFTAVVFSLVAAGTVSAATQQSPAPITGNQTTVLEQCLNPETNAAAATNLAAAIRAAVAALPQTRSSADDLEATILFTISQRNLCPGVARAALDQLGGGNSTAFAQAVSHVRTSLLDRNVGTAGLRSAGSSFGAGTFFSPPVVGIGGGSATYSQ